MPNQDYGDWEAPPEKEVIDGLFHSWKDANPGDYIQGTVLEIDLEEGGKNFQGETCGYVRLDTEDGERIATLNFAALTDDLKRYDPPIRAKDRIRITFDGWVNLKTREGKRKEFSIKLQRYTGNATGDGDSI